MAAIVECVSCQRKDTTVPPPDVLFSLSLTLFSLVAVRLIPYRKTCTPLHIFFFDSLERSALTLTPVLLAVLTARSLAQENIFNPSLKTDSLKRKRKIFFKSIATPPSAAMLFLRATSEMDAHDSQRSYQTTIVDGPKQNHPYTFKRAFALLDGASATTGTATSIVQPMGEAWICRLSTYNGPCALRGTDEVPSGRYCVEKRCCSKTKCKGLGECGGWCTTDSVLCLIRNYNYGGDKCSCTKLRHYCDLNAECIDRLVPLGGAFCECREGFYGTGKKCEVDPCFANPCSPGVCERQTEGSDTYHCICPSTTNLIISEEGMPSCEAKPNYCLTEPCGPDALDCISFDEGSYECICKDGYSFSGSACIKKNWCESSPCGADEAVHECVSNLLDYSCFCKNNYTVVVDAAGHQRCQADPCNSAPCGPAELVSSCNEATNDTGEVTGFFCVCSDIAELQKDPQTNLDVCQVRNVCETHPCGPPEATISCYFEGSTYRCMCQIGYTELITSGKARCVQGDPCSVGACGEAPFVEECVTDAVTYSCRCSSDVAFLNLRGNREFCEPLSSCRDDCGSLDNLESCLKNDSGETECKCKPGYTRTASNGEVTCSEEMICDGSPCGSADAVASCIPGEGSSYKCACKDGYELRSYGSDNKEVCAAPNSCLGDPCGTNAAVEECIEGSTEYTCICAPFYSPQKSTNGISCLPTSAVTPAPESAPNTQNNGKTESGSFSTWTMIACAGAAVLLLAFVAARVLSRRRKREEDALEQHDGRAVENRYISSFHASSAVQEPCSSNRLDCTFSMWQ